jgi:hypothetical protein
VRFSQLLLLLGWGAAAVEGLGAEGFLLVGIGFEGGFLVGVALRPGGMGFLGPLVDRMGARAGAGFLLGGFLRAGERDGGLVAAGAGVGRGFVDIFWFLENGMEWDGGVGVRTCRVSRA